MLFKIIIVDDEKKMCNNLIKWIRWEEMGFDVTAILNDGKDAIKYLSEHSVDVVLTDIKMTFVSGIDVARHVFEEELPVKVVLLSAYQEFKYAREAIKYNVVDYILKPVSLDEIQKLFRKIYKQLENEHAIHTVAEEKKLTVESLVIQKVKGYIQNNLGKEITLEYLADHVQLSSVYLSRLFKEKTGINYIDYLLEQRITKAKELLKDPTKKIYEVSYEVGYPNEKYFYRLFKKTVGCTPSQFRNR